MQVSELLNGIRKKDLVLPEFQREYVWGKDQAKQLLVSLRKEYPVGALLLWRTDDPPELKNLNDLPERVGTVDVILDGQQRLTTLYLLLQGEIPPYYREKDIQNDPRELYYNLQTGEFQYYQASAMKGNPLWQKVLDCFKENINVFEIAKGQDDTHQDEMELAQTLNENLNQLKAIQNVAIPIQTVPPDATLDEAIDIFDRVNSQGTKLTDAELALAHITGKWPSARRVMKKKIDTLTTKHFNFDLTFMTRALTGVVTHRGLFEAIHHTPKEELKGGWDTLSQILDYLVNILPENAYVDSTEDLNTTNVLVPLIVYLSLNERRFPKERSMRHAIHWLYAAHTWKRYTAQTDQRLEYDIQLIVREEEPWDALCQQIIEQRGRIRAKADDFEGRGVRHPLYRMVYIMTKANGAVDWFHGTPLAQTHGDDYKVHSHHIFPKSILYDHGYNADNHIQRKLVNEIANRAFLTRWTNQTISNKQPKEYLPDIEKNYPGALENQFVPDNQNLWEIDHYEMFLKTRRERLAEALNSFMDDLIEEPAERRERPITELIKRGESSSLEFKSTLQWDVREEKKNVHLRKSTLKNVAAFLNTEGGTVIIGVEDNGSIYGLEDDINELRGSEDRFEQLLSSLFTDQIGLQFTPFIEARIEKIDGKKVCVIDVDKAPEPAFLGDDKEFYIRSQTTTRPLNSEETLKYIESHWD